MSLTPPPKVQKLQEALHAKAKGSPDYRFYALYDKVYRARRAGARLRTLPIQRRRAGRGRPDVRGHRGVRAWTVAGRTGGRTEEARRIVRSRCGGCTSPSRTASSDRWGSRRSGIVWCRWRRCWSWNRSSRPTCSRSSTPTGPDAVRWTRSGRSTRCCNSGHTEVVDADLSGYFDSIPHAELMKSVARRISDRHLLRLIKMWLEAPVEETDERGRHHRTTRNKDEGRGTPARGSDLAAVGQPLHAAIHSGLEDAGTRAAVSTPRSSTMPTTS